MASLPGPTFTLRIALLTLFGAAACGPVSVSRDGGSGSQPDEDGDGISDADEGRAEDQDTDGDGTPDYLDTDSDDDGIGDSHEAGDGDASTPPRDADHDGIPDFRDTDSDDNGRLDDVDGEGDADMDGLPDFADLDDDGDSILDVVELGDNPSSPLDSDQDGTPDFRDRDSDDDLILDIDELVRDGDDDGIPAYLDHDSDGDCLGDEIEAGDDVLATPPVDTDDDTRPDFLDIDSDSDGLLDSLEDANCNGTREPGESSPTAADTDGDGVTDLIEFAAGTDPGDADDNPQSHGDFVFTVPYHEAPDPTIDTLDFATDIVQADVAFAMDTTGSMGGEITNLKASILSVISSLAAGIPNLAFGVGGYDDFPMSPYGAFPDQPWYLRHRVMTVNTPAGLSSVQAAVNTYALHNGADGPESGWEALYQLATGDGVSVGLAAVPAFSGTSALPVPIPATESVGTIGGIGFRAGSFPIVVMITDYDNHNNGVAWNAYSFSGAATRTSAIAEATALGIRVIGVVSDGGSGIAARDDLRVAVNGTGSIVPPTAWGTSATGRPAGCATTQCCTGINGAGEATVGGMCPLLFRVDSAGTGMGTAIVKAIEVLTTYAVIDISAEITDGPGDAVNAVAAFVDHIKAKPTAGAPCAPGLTAIDTNGDGRLDTFTNVNPGATVCFDVVPKMNNTIMPLEVPQMFRATITVIGDGITDLDERDVYFLVPPVISDIPID